MMDSNYIQPGWQQQLEEDAQRALIKVNFKYRKIYFNVLAIRALRLDEESFRIFKRGKRWLLIKTQSPSDFKTRCHQYAFYITSKQLVFNLARDFQHENPSFTIEQAERNRRYYELKFFEPPVKIVKAKAEGADNKVRIDRKIISSRKVVAQYEETNFPGRIKTGEVLNAEKTLNRRW